MKTLHCWWFDFLGGKRSKRGGSTHTLWLIWTLMVINVLRGMKPSNTFNIAGNQLWGEVDCRSLMIIYLLSPLLSRGEHIWPLCASDRPCIDLYTWRGGDRTDPSTRGAVPFNIQVPTKSSIVMSALSINTHAQILDAYLQASSSAHLLTAGQASVSLTRWFQGPHTLFSKHMDLHLGELEHQGAPSLGITVGGGGNLEPVSRKQCRCIFDW